MRAAQLGGHLAFYGDLVLDDRDGDLFMDDCIVAIDRGFPLLHDAGRGVSNLAGEGISESFSITERIGNLEAESMIRWVTGSNNRVSPASICIPLIRLKKPAVGP
jgi:hypothetical protein